MVERFYEPTALGRNCRSGGLARLCSKRRCLPERAALMTGFGASNIRATGNAGRVRKQVEQTLQVRLVLRPSMCATNLLRLCQAFPALYVYIIYIVEYIDEAD